MPTKKEPIELKIVVVDDSDFSRKTIVETIEAHNYSVVGQANSAENAASIIRTTPCNLFIIDVVMPDASGIDLAQLIQEEMKDCAIILMSSLKMENIIIESISCGAMDYLQKPFSKDTLIKSIRKVHQELEKGL